VSSTLRVAFVGQSVYFRQCALEQRADGIEPCFLDFRAGAPPERLRAELRERDPDVVLVFRPEIVPKGLFHGMRAFTIGYLTEPLPRGNGRDAHEDLRARMWWLKQVDPSNFDRVVSFDPLIAEVASTVLPVWRSLPIPVADSVYMDVRARATPPRVLFLGRSTEHRERLLAEVKRTHPIVHIGHGLYGERLMRFLLRSDVQLNLHNHAYPTFENRVCLALAAGHLVISESLSPTHGLLAGEHFLEANTPERFAQLVDELARDPGAYSEVQAAGRASAERFRASHVYPELIREAMIAGGAGGREARDSPDADAAT
jgi:hypothetical protein